MKECTRLKEFEGIFEGSFCFAACSSIGCGGFAKAAYFPRSVEETARLIQTLNEENIPYYVLGNLTNVLPPDEGTERVIVSTKRLRGVQIGERTFVLAGTGSGELLTAAKKAGFTGAEFLYGIPCTLGGALYMNAGAGGKYIAEIVEKVLVLRAGKLEYLPVEDCRYAYKKSAFMQNDDVILGGELRLQPSDEDEIEKKRAYFLQRRAHLPKERSMGCVFKNPEGRFAGDLIERSGLKGLRIGGARISPKHANFIVNDGGATAKDIRALIALIKGAVRAQYGVLLEEEIRYID